MMGQFYDGSGAIRGTPCRKETNLIPKGPERPSVPGADGPAGTLFWQAIWLQLGLILSIENGKKKDNWLSP
jgi:hypothetical protein